MLQCSAKVLCCKNLIIGVTEDMFTHFKNALLCPINRNETMREHNCSELELLEHPEWLLAHYYKYVEVSDSEKEEIRVFLETRGGKQITKAFLCPINRNGTREVHHLSDEDLRYKYSLLIIHYKKHGGA